MHLSSALPPPKPPARFQLTNENPEGKDGGEGQQTSRPPRRGQNPGFPNHPGQLSFGGTRRAAITPYPLLSPALSFFDAENVACQRSLALDLHGLLWDIFVSIFESRFAIWLSDSCCPFIEMTVVGPRLSQVTREVTDVSFSMIGKESLYF